MKTNRTPLNCVRDFRDNVRKSTAPSLTGLLLSFWLLFIGAAGCSAGTICPEGSTEQQGTCVLGKYADVPQDWVPSLGLDSPGEQGADTISRPKNHDGVSTTDAVTQDMGDGIAQQSLDTESRSESDLQSSRASNHVNTHYISQNDESGYELELLRSSTACEIYPDVHLLHAPLLSRPPTRRTERGYHVQDNAFKYPTRRGACSDRGGQPTG